MKYLICILMFIPFLAQAQVVPESIFDKINRFAIHFDVPPKELTALIRCETQNTFDTYIQSKAIQPYGRERSYGLVQLHLPAHPEITYAQATDPDFALIWAGKNWKNRHNEWRTCMKNLNRYL